MHRARVLQRNGISGFVLEVIELLQSLQVSQKSHPFLRYGVKTATPTRDVESFPEVMEITDVTSVMHYKRTDNMPLFLVGCTTSSYDVDDGRQHTPVSSGTETSLTSHRIELSVPVKKSERLCYEMSGCLLDSFTSQGLRS